MEDTNKKLNILYRNWRGKLKWRVITPVAMIFTKIEYYPDEQWFIEAYDEEKKEIRHFAVKNIMSFNNTEVENGRA